LDRQSLRPDFIIVVPDQGRGANWARNRGIELCTTEFVLPSDADISWYPDALENLHASLQRHPEASYSFGSYDMGDTVYCMDPFDAELLKRRNIASTMSLVRRLDFCGFDESILRFQDWDAWLTMLERGKIGIHCGSHIFKTETRQGITLDPSISCTTALEVISRKHNLS
jgi:glycosyltransferase involved in cell wall biosynthesis